MVEEKSKCIYYSSPDIQNELIRKMGLQELREIAKDLQTSTFLTVMCDKTTDASNKEQVTLIIQWITEELQVHEEFPSLYSVSSIDAETLTSVIYQGHILKIEFVI